MPLRGGGIGERDRASDLSWLAQSKERPGSESGRSDRFKVLLLSPQNLAHLQQVLEFKNSSES